MVLRGNERRLEHDLNAKGPPSSAERPFATWNVLGGIADAIHLLGRQIFDLVGLVERGQRLRER